jgi:hypothetical protein
MKNKTIAAILTNKKTLNRLNNSLILRKRESKGKEALVITCLVKIMEVNKVLQ